MKEILDPYLSQGLTILVQITALAFFYGLILLRKKLMEVLSAHLNARQQEMLDLLAREAYAFAETAYSQLKGHEKLRHALDYLEAQAKLKGIPFDAAQAKIALEKAWLEMEGMPKRLQSI